VRIEELNTHELLELDPEGGVIRFAGQRVLLFDAVAMGLLRKYLVENFGLTAARTVLSQFGFAHGWRMAETIQNEFAFDSDEDWRRAGPRLHTLEGLFRVQQGADDALSPSGSVLTESYEAEQHLVHFGRADEPACWTIAGLMSGYLSCTRGEETFVLEDRCVARGDAACHLLARSRADWGRERADDLAVYDARGLQECLDVSLRRVTSTLQAAEQALRVRRRVLDGVPDRADTPPGVVARSRVMATVLDLARRVAMVESTVLVTGETGTGKERIARLVHDASARAAGPFIAVNCGAIAETLLESELFGHCRGAFTGATQNRLGLFEAAQHGTLLLDEIGDVSPAMQVKLLRVLQEREIRRVGENVNRPIDVRVVAATNRDLSPGGPSLFRDDLYFRLRVVELHVPALRERREDILILARLLLGEAAARMGRTLTTMSPAVADRLVRYPWPGNVRELENAMERAAALALGARVELGDLPEELREPVADVRPEQGSVRPLSDVTREYILAALESNGGNHKRTAEELQIGSATLYRKLKAYRADAPTSET
jgi:DNA-binding NtrC family response regulator